MFPETSSPPSTSSAHSTITADMDMDMLDDDRLDRAKRFAETLESIHITVFGPRSALIGSLRALAIQIDNLETHDISPVNRKILFIIMEQTRRWNSTLTQNIFSLLTEASEEDNERAGIQCRFGNMWSLRSVPIMEPATCHDGNIEFLPCRHLLNIAGPKPDIAYGFTFKSGTKLRHIIDRPSIRDMLDICHEGLFFPFFTVEMKSPWNGEGIGMALIRCAEAGAAAVNSIDKFYRFCGLDPTPVDTCHFSMVINQYSAFLHIHWRREQKGDVFWEMSHLSSFTLLTEKNIVALRGNLSNLFKWASTTRLHRIKQSLMLFDNSAVPVKKPRTSIDSRSAANHSSNPPSLDDNKETTPPPRYATRSYNRKRLSLPSETSEPPSASESYGI